MYDLARFNSSDMIDCAIALRNIGQEGESMEEVANRTTSYLYEHLRDRNPAQSACVLVRFFKTHPYIELDKELQKAAMEILGSSPKKPSTRCLTLLATKGDRADWNSRQESQGHKAIPLISKDFVSKVPMISQLIQQFGLEVEDVLEPTPELAKQLNKQVFDVFYIPEVIGSAYIPAQKDFAIPYKLQSVIGFGGMLPSGNIIALLASNLATLN